MITDHSRERLRSLLLAGLIAIYVARPLLPSEAPTTVAGDGLPFVVLTLVLASVWLLFQAVERRVTVRFGLAEGGWIVLLACQAVSACLATQTGYARAAINTFWEWAGIGVGYLLLRQLSRNDREKRAAMVVMIGLSLVLSLDGIYQYFVELPTTRALYELHPERVLKEAGIDAPPGSAARQLFEQRLRSTEPSATFALANSLAGFLTPWLLMTIGLGWLGQCSAPAWRRVVRAAMCALPMAFCLILTKSRAGCLAVLAGFAAMLLLSRRNRRQAWQIAAGCAGIASVLVGAGFVSGALDRQILTEAFKSLSYRWHYWQGALGMIREHAWFGCGPGNFQDEYTRFKLPEASEVVADPHNFVFEIWATSGTTSLLAFVIILVGAALQWRRANGGAASLTLRVSENEDGLPIASLLAGGIAGLLLAFAVGQFTTVGLPLGVLLAGLIVLPSASLLFYPWISGGQAPILIPFVCALALLINLLAAGGIGFAGVAGSLWLLAAVAMPNKDKEPASPPRWCIIGLCGASVLLVAACYWTAYRPVLECRRLLALADRDAPRVRTHLVAATEADPLADEPWRQLAAVDFARWQQDVSATGWEQDQEEVLKRRPHSSAAWLDAAERYFAAYARNLLSNDQETSKKYLLAAVSHYRKAAELYPNFPLVHAKLALATATARQPESEREAALALTLHDQTPHQDQKLPPELLKAVEKLARTTD